MNRINFDTKQLTQIGWAVIAFVLGWALLGPLIDSAWSNASTIDMTTEGSRAESLAWPIYVWLFAPIVILLLVQAFPKALDPHWGLAFMLMGLLFIASAAQAWFAGLHAESIIVGQDLVSLFDWVAPVGATLLVFVGIPMILSRRKYKKVDASGTQHMDWLRLGATVLPVLPVVIAGRQLARFVLEVGFSYQSDSQFVGALIAGADSTVLRVRENLPELGLVVGFAVLAAFFFAARIVAGNGGNQARS